MPDAPTPVPVPVGQVQRLADEERRRIESFRRCVERPVLTTEPGDVPVVALPASEAAFLLGVIDRQDSTLRRQDEVLHHAANEGCADPGWWEKADCLSRSTAPGSWCASCAALAFLFGQAGDIDEGGSADGPE